MHCGTSNCRCPIPPIVAPIKTRTACWIMSFRARRTCHRQAQPCSKHSRCKPDHFFLPLLFHSSSFIGVIDLHFQLHSQLQEYNCDNYTTIGLRLQYSQPSLHNASRNTHYCSRVVTVRVRADSRYNSDIPIILCHTHLITPSPSLDYCRFHYRILISTIPAYSRYRFPYRLRRSRIVVEIEALGEEAGLDALIAYGK